MAIKEVAKMMPPKKLRPSKCRSLDGDGGATFVDTGTTVVAGDGTALDGLLGIVVVGFLLGVASVAGVIGVVTVLAVVGKIGLEVLSGLTVLLASDGLTPSLVAGRVVGITVGAIVLADSSLVELVAFVELAALLVELAVLPLEVPLAEAFLIVLAT